MRVQRQPNGMMNPQIHVTRRAQAGATYGRGAETVSVPYKNLRELRKELLEHLKSSVDGTLSVSRSKRGQGFEWFENWELQNGKAVLVKEGWQ